MINREYCRRQLSALIGLLVSLLQEVHKGYFAMAIVSQKLIDTADVKYIR